VWWDFCVVLPHWLEGVQNVSPSCFCEEILVSIDVNIALRFCLFIEAPHKALLLVIWGHAHDEVMPMLATRRKIHERQPLESRKFQLLGAECMYTDEQERVAFDAELSYQDATSSVGTVL
jgi:hypothetical protein